MKRFDSIDVMRALAIIFMIICHFIIYLSSPEGNHPWIYLFANHIIGDFAAPIFVFLVGMSQAISLSKQSKSERLLDASGIRMIKRGLFIILFGLISSVLIFGPTCLFDWDILPFIGFSLIVLFFLRKTPLRILLFISLIAIILAPTLRELSGYAYYWGGPIKEVSSLAKVFPGFLFDPIAEYNSNFVFNDVIKGFFVNGFFPIFPWIAFPLIGYALGQTNLTGNKTGWFDRKSGLLGIFLIITGFGGAIYASNNHLNNTAITSLSFYPDSTTLLLIQLGVCFSLFYTCRQCFDNSLKESGFIKYFRLLSKYSLTIYVFQDILIFWPIWIMGWLSGDINKYYCNAISAPTALLFSIITLVLFYPLLYQWNEKGGKYSFEWTLQKLIPSQKTNKLFHKE